MISRFVASQLKHNSYFLVGCVLGLFLAIVVVPFDEGGETCTVALDVDVTVGDDEFEPKREQRPLGPSGTLGRSVTRPRYFSTELGMRDALLSAVLSGESALGSRVAALNRTATPLQPALKFFITASGIQSAPGAPNVVAFTDTREMLKPFHALKYLADDYLEEYDFFFLVSDLSYVNAQRLKELVSKLSISQDVYMGVVADNDSHYCSLDGGIIISNSVLRSVQGELDWCVRNSYSPHHHENLGRCILHAAHLECMSELQGQSYSSIRVDPENIGAAMTASLADAVTAYPATEPKHQYKLHAAASRLRLERLRREAAAAGRGGALRQRAPRGFRNESWPRGLRLDPALGAPKPQDRFDHARWTLLNASHAFLPDDRSALQPHSAAHRRALDLVVREACAWLAARSEGAEGAAGAEACSLVEGARLWLPSGELRYRLQLSRSDGARWLELSRVLGAARLAAVPFATESARLALLLLLGGGCSREGPDQQAEEARAFLRRWAAKRPPNAELLVALLEPRLEAALDAAPASSFRLLRVAAEGGCAASEVRAAEVAVRALGSRDAPLLLVPAALQASEEFLNRARLGAVCGASWARAVPFARFAQAAHPAFVAPDGSRPRAHTGRFDERREALAFCRRDFERALASWRAGGRSGGGGVAAVLGAARELRCVWAPEPQALLSPPGAPPASPRPVPRDLPALDLGDPAELAKLLLQTQASRADL